MNPRRLFFHGEAAILCILTFFTPGLAAIGLILDPVLERKKAEIHK